MSRVEGRRGGGERREGRGREGRLKMTCSRERVMEEVECMNMDMKGYVEVKKRSMRIGRVRVKEAGREGGPMFN